MNHQQRFQVDKTTRTFADSLIAFGLAKVLDQLLDRQVAGGVHDILIADRGSYYELTCSPALDMNIVRYLPERLCPALPIRTIKNAASFPSDISEGLVIDYEEDKEAAGLFYAARQKGGATELALPHFWEFERAINPLTLPGYNGLVFDWWKLDEHQSEALLILLNLFVTTPNDYAQAIDAWKVLDKTYGWGIKAETTCQQLYNPDQGKGQNNRKADGISIGNLTGFWLVEWLKAVGFYEAAITRTVRGAKDRKTFVIAPRELSFTVNHAVMQSFVSAISSETSVKFDILAALRYTRALLDHFSKEETWLARLFGGKSIQQRVVAGFDTAFYKDLGNATATMNISFIALPGWVIVSSRDDIALYNHPKDGLLVQLDNLVRQFDESHSDAFTLLQYLRDFVSGDDLEAFFRFTNAFTGYYMGKQERGQYAYPLYTYFIERLVMATEQRLTPILESQGFQNIAYAIRQSTVTAQYRKKQGDKRYDVRYGLGQELARKARYPDAFIAALSDFLHKYNAENAQVMETRPGPYRTSIKTTDIDEIVWLIDQYGSETVANLLIAYGYARVPREDDSQDQSTAQENA